MIEGILAFLVMAVVVSGAMWRGERWRRKHMNDPKPEEPVVTGASAFTGEIIATGQATTTLGDGLPPESPYT
jgi:hypothetical protein